MSAIISEERMSDIEAIANIVIGFWASWAAAFFILGYSAGGSLAVTAMFFALSFARSYALSLIFKRLKNGNG